MRRSSAKGWAKTPSALKDCPKPHLFPLRLSAFLPLRPHRSFRNGGVPTLAGIHSLPSLKATLLGTQKVRLGENSVWASASRRARARSTRSSLEEANFDQRATSLLSASCTGTNREGPAGVEIKAILEAFDEGGANAPNMPNLLSYERLNGGSGNQMEAPRAFSVHLNTMERRFRWTDGKLSALPPAESIL